MVAALLGHQQHYELQQTKIITHTPRQYHRRQCAEVTRWVHIYWLINNNFCDSQVSPSRQQRTSSRHHQPQLPSPPFTTSNPHILFNTSMARGSRNLKVRNAFYQHIFLDVLTHLHIFRNSHDVSWHCPQHHPYQPQTPTGHWAVKYTLLARGCGNGKVRYYF